MGHHEPPDYSRGDESTLGGYMAVHARPASFEGSDGRPYTVAIESDETGERDRPFGAYLLFVCWGGEQPAITGHLESPFLTWGATAEEAVAALGAFPLLDVKHQLDALIGAHSAPGRPWWEAMRDEGEE
jgi:hypothetical protein